MGTQAEEAGVDILTGCAASEVCFDGNGAVTGVVTQDMGIAKDGTHKETYMPGVRIAARVTLFGEGCRGSLSEVR